MAFQADGLGVRGGGHEAVEFRFALGAGKLAVASGMKLDDRRAKRDCRVEIGWIRLDEQRNADARLRQSPDIGLQMIEAAKHVEPAFRRPLLALLGHDADRKSTRLN